MNQEPKFVEPGCIRVNGERIGETAIAREAQNHPASSPDEAWREAALALAVRQILLNEARRLKIEPEPESVDGKIETDDDAMIRQLIDRQVCVPRPDKKSCERYFQSNKAKFFTADLFEPRHILIAADPLDEDDYNRAVEKAGKLIALLQEKPERFSELAAEHSDCTSKETGGSLGQISRGQSVPEFETFLVNLEEGQLCPVAACTRYGAHVIRLDRKIEGEQLPFEAVEERVAAFLEEQSWRRAVHQYIAVLVGQSDIEGLDLEGAQSPLVQ